eukprot:scaffold170755_cov78-Cyclotella_meneghiniana.AAC.2
MRRLIICPRQPLSIGAEVTGAEDTGADVTGEGGPGEGGSGEGLTGADVTFELLAVFVDFPTDLVDLVPVWAKTSERVAR